MRRAQDVRRWRQDGSARSVPHRRNDLPMSHGRFFSRMSFCKSRRHVEADRIPIDDFERMLRALAPRPPMATTSSIS
jgi:hypothetical protein